MASAVTEAAPSAANDHDHIPHAPRGRARYRGGAGGGSEHGRGRGRGAGYVRGGRGRARGGVGINTDEPENLAIDRAARGRGRPHQRSHQRETTGLPLSANSAAGEALGHGLERKETVVSQPTTTHDKSEEATCFICANTFQYYSIAPCNHTTCHICSLRMRALYANKACAHCRTETQFVILSKDGEKRYEEYDHSSIVTVDDKLGIKYTDHQILDETKVLLRYNCPQQDCDVACMGWRDLHSHVRTAHNRVMCRLCTRNKKVFTHEQSLFTQAELRKHEREGDDAPGTVDQSGFKGHPECGFCRERYYSSDELYVHCRQAHERCHICDRENYTQNYQYYQNYDALVEHFGKAHHPCHEPECLEKKFQVFASLMELKAHQLEAHRGKLTKEEVRDARRVDLSQFEDSRPLQHNRGRGRGRDPILDVVPARTEIPLRRDELAYQRTLQIQSAQSNTTRTFGGQLTSPMPSTPVRPLAPAAVQTRPVQTGPIAQPARPPVSQPAFESQFPALTIAANTSAAPPTPISIDDAKQARHKAVLDRASNLLRNDQKKIDVFKNQVSEYKRSVKTARELCDSFWSLFATSANELGKLIKELAELYENEQKKSQLLSAWNSWKTLNEDYPPFAGSSSSGGTNIAAGSRVLKIKSSTTPSAKGQQKAGWGSVESSASTSNASVPLVSPPSSQIASRGLPVQDLWIPSTASPSASAQSSSKIQLVPPTTAQRIASAGQSSDREGSTNNVVKTVHSKAEFPALPPKKPMHSFGPVIRNTASGGRGTAVKNAWQKTSSENNSIAAVVNETDGENVGDETGGSGKKKKGKTKQTLFHFG